MTYGQAPSVLVVTRNESLAETLRQALSNAGMVCANMADAATVSAVIVDTDTADKSVIDQINAYRLPVVTIGNGAGDDQIRHVSRNSTFLAKPPKPEAIVDHVRGIMKNPPELVVHQGGNQS